MRIRAALLLAALVTASCRGTAPPCGTVAGACLAIRVEGGDGARLDELRFDLCGDVNDSFSRPLAGVHPPLLLTNALPARAASGHVTVSVVGLVQGHPVALGRAAVTLDAQGRGEITVNLGPLPDAAPILNCVVPPRGMMIGGTAVSLRGAGFQSSGALPRRVQFGGVEATGPIAQPTDFELQLTAPPSETRGPVAVAVSNSDGASTSAAGLFSYGGGQISFELQAEQNVEILISPVVADFDGDGRSDLAFIEPPGTVRVRSSLGDGTFGMATVIVGKISTSGVLQAADLNHDGRPDLLAIDSINGLTTAINDGGGAKKIKFLDPNFTPIAANAAAAAILDADGLDGLDVVTFHTGQNDLSAHLGDLNGTFGAAASVDSGGRVSPILASTDLDGDPWPDLLAPLYGNPQLVLLRGAGAGAFNPPSSLQLGLIPTSLLLADLDGDGRRDIVVGDSEKLEVKLANAVNPGEFLDGKSTMVTMARRVTASDFDGDRREDLAVVSSKKAFLLISDGTGGFVPYTLLDPIDGFELLPGDFDGDGRRDLLLAHVSVGNMIKQNQIVVLRNTTQ